jgi:hypothetical protein
LIARDHDSDIDRGSASRNRKAAGVAGHRSPLLVRMHAKVRRDLARFGQLDHVYRWRLSCTTGISARLPGSRSAYRADAGSHRGAGSRASYKTAFDLKPTIPAIEALPDSRRRLCRAAVALHLDRPCLGFGAVGLTYGLAARFRAPSARIFAPMIRPP